MLINSDTEILRVQEKIKQNCNYFGVFYWPKPRYPLQFAYKGFFMNI